MQFRILCNKHIDKALWDKRIAEEAAAPIYNSSCYLDAMTPGWKALVGGDYEILLALPIRKKWNITLLANPPFLQKLSIIGDYEKYTSIIQAMLLKQFKLIDIHLEQRLWTDTQCHVKERCNLELPLNRSYEAIASGYANLAKRSIKKAAQCGFELQTNIPAKEIINDFAQFYAQKSTYTASHLQKLIQFCEQHPESITSFGVVKDKERLYSCLFLQDKKRLYYLISAPTLSGQESKALYWCIDKVIAQEAATDRILDFEGSDIPNVAFFYTRFGANNVPYYNFKLNNMAWGLNQLIRYKLGF